MHAPTSLLNRLDRLEQENRRWRRASGLLLVVLFATFTLAWRSPGRDVLEGERLVLRSADGTEYATLGPDGEGHPMLFLREGESHAVLTLNGPAVHLRGTDGRRSAFLGMDSRNASRLSLTSENLQDGVRAVVHEDGTSGVFVLGEKGFERASIEYPSGAGGQVTVRGEKGQVRGSFSVDPAHVASTILLDTSGRRRVGMLVQADGTPLVSMEDEEGRPRTNLTMKFDGSPRLETLHTNGQPSWKAP